MVDKLGADLRHTLPVESLVGFTMSCFLILLYLSSLIHVVVGVQWPFGSWNVLRLGLSSQSSTTGKRAYDRRNIV